MITHSSFPNLHGPWLENQGGAVDIEYSTASFADSSFGSNSAVRCVCCDTNVLGKIFMHSTYAWAHAQVSLVTSSRPHHTLAVMPTHTLMHPPPSYPLGGHVNHVSTPAACRGALVRAPSATATWVHSRTRLGFCLLQTVSRHARARHLYHFLATLCCGYRVNHLRDACADKHTTKHGLVGVEALQTCMSTRATQPRH